MSGLQPLYDAAWGFVIRAETEDRARELASEQACDEGAKQWMSPQSSTCVELTVEGDEEVVICDFNAG